MFSPLLCMHSHFDEDSLIFCLAPIVSTFSKVLGGTPKQHRSPKDAYNCTNIVKHNFKVHEIKSKRARQADVSMVAGVMEDSGGALTLPSFAPGPLQKFLTPITNVQERKRARQKVKLMKFYVYGKCSISANTLNDPYFRDVLKAGDPNYAIMDRQERHRQSSTRGDGTSRPNTDGGSNR